MLTLTKDFATNVSVTVKSIKWLVRWNLAKAAIFLESSATGDVTLSGDSVKKAVLELCLNHLSELTGVSLDQIRFVGEGWGPSLSFELNATTTFFEPLRFKKALPEISQFGAGFGEEFSLMMTFHGGHLQLYPKFVGLWVVGATESTVTVAVRCVNSDIKIEVVTLLEDQVELIEWEALLYVCKFLANPEVNWGEVLSKLKIDLYSNPSESTLPTLLHVQIPKEFWRRRLCNVAPELPPETIALLY